MTFSFHVWDAGGLMFSNSTEAALDTFPVWARQKQNAPNGKWTQRCRVHREQSFYSAVNRVLHKAFSATFNISPSQPGSSVPQLFLKWHYYVYYILHYSETRCIFVLCQRRSVPRIGTEIIQPLFERTRSITGVTARLTLWCPRQPFVPLIVRVNGCNILH